MTKFITLCHKKVLYDTPNIVAIYYYVWKQQYASHLEVRLIKSSGIRTRDLSIVRQTRCHLSYRASVDAYFMPPNFFHSIFAGWILFIAPHVDTIHVAVVFWKCLDFTSLFFYLKYCENVSRLMFMSKLLKFYWFKITYFKWESGDIYMRLNKTVVYTWFLRKLVRQWCTNVMTFYMQLEK